MDVELFSEAFSAFVSIIMIFLLRCVNVAYYPSVSATIEQNVHSCSKPWLYVLFLCVVLDFVYYVL